MSVLTAYHECFGEMPVVRHLPEGLTLAEMTQRMPLPEDFGIHGHICLNGEEIPRFAWGAVRPKSVISGSAVPNYVTFHYPPRGGGGGGDKNVVSLVASVALTAATASIAGGFFATQGGLFAAGSLSATALAAGVSLTGALLLGALTSGPSRNFGVNDQFLQSELGKSSADGNILAINGHIPRVVGTRKVFPYFAAEPFTYFDGQAEVTEAVYCLAGPHRLENIRVGSALAADMEGVEIETREGWPGDRRLSLVSKQAKTQTANAELTGAIVDEETGNNLDAENVTEAANVLPKAQTYFIGKDADEHQIQLLFQGLNYQASTTTYVRIPFRLRIREAGSETWKNLPELHYQAATLNALRATIRIFFEDGSALVPAASGFEGFVEARLSSPAQAVAPVNDVYDADASFDNGTGSADYLDNGTTGSTKLQGVVLGRYDAKIYLDPSEFPKGVNYEVEIRRGHAFRVTNYTASSYQYSGSVWDLFGYRGETSPFTIVEDRQPMNDVMFVGRSVSVWNEHPVPVGSDLALIAVKATNVRISDLSVEASGYVKDWNGTGWTNWTTTSNPAPHLRDIYVGRLNLDALPASRVDDDMLLDFRTFCAAEGYECNAIIEEQSVASAAQIVAACGYGSPYKSEVYGVIWDYDRSAEEPVQMFNARRVRDLSWEKAFPPLPDGFLVNFNDEANDFKKRQIAVLRTGIQQSRRLEQANYEGLITEAEVLARAQFDLKQADERGVFYNFTTDVKNIACRRGSLIGLNHYELLRNWGGARITRIVYDGSGDIAAVELDMPFETLANDDMHDVTDMHAVTDMHSVGAQTGIVITKDDGTFTDAIPVSNGGENTHIFSFDPAISPTDISVGADVTIGLVGQVYDRMIVMGIEPKENFTATITCVDEAPQLFA